MKRSLVLFFFAVLGLVIATTPCLNAQQYSGTPGVTVRFVNSTGDASMVGVEIGGFHATRLIPYGGHLDVPYPDYSYGLLGNRAVPYAVTACPADHTTSWLSADGMPQWVMDVNYLGGAAIPADYFQKSPIDERDFNARMGAIINVIKGRHELGRKEERIKPLEAWMKQVKRVGLRQEHQACAPTSEWTGTLNGGLDISSFYGWRVIIIEITERHPTYHSAIKQGW